MSDADQESRKKAAATHNTGEASDIADRLVESATLCPYCGHTQAPAKRCERCGGMFEPLSRMATQIAMGPWSIRDEAQPFMPGMSFQTVLKMVKSGRVKRETVMRGPTTQQFWLRAEQVPGVAPWLGVCHACQGKVKPGVSRCVHCGEQLDVLPDRDRLGLAYPTQAEADAAGMQLKQQQEAAMRGESGGNTATATELAEQGAVERLRVNIQETSKTAKAVVVGQSSFQTGFAGTGAAGGAGGVGGGGRDLGINLVPSGNVMTTPPPETGPSSASTLPEVASEAPGDIQGFPMWVWLVIGANVVAALAVGVLVVATRW